MNTPAATPAPTPAAAEARRELEIRNARMHNLKGVSLKLPRGRLIVVTGVSGSGKSSLVFDTLYAEGHRRYVESLSAYARQFMERLPKPEVDAILGLSPAIALEQRTSQSGSRSTVGTVTEVYDYLRLLFARVGHTISPVSGEEVKADQVHDVVDAILALSPSQRAMLMVEVPMEGRDTHDVLEIQLQKGYARLWADEQAQDIETLLQDPNWEPSGPVYLIIDRLTGPDAETLADDDALQTARNRLADSVSTAFAEGFGRCTLWVEGTLKTYSDRFERDGLLFERPTPELFHFNTPYGVCPTCEGHGSIMGYDAKRIIPDPTKSVAEGAVACWTTPTTRPYQQRFIERAKHEGFPIHRPVAELTEDERHLLWHGNERTIGIYDMLKDLEQEVYKIQVRVFLSRYRGYTTCPECNGSRLRKAANYVRVGGHTMGTLLLDPVATVQAKMDALDLTDHEAQVARRLLVEIRTRLAYLVDVGLGYLSLNRRANTLSGGETQRIHLARALGSSLVGSLYILDEPSIGLHPRDGDRLIAVMQALRGLGNTVVVVEHDEAVMRAADHVVDMGPLAGEHGGEVVFSGPASAIESAQTLTADYLTGRRQIPIPSQRRQPNQWLRLVGAAEHNLKQLTVPFPLGALTVVTGVSGSGKTTLVKRVLHPALQRQLDQPVEAGAYDRLEGDLDLVEHVELVDQNALGRNVRSNPVTYCGAYDGIRELYAGLPAARQNRLKPAHFSFNVDGGRCDTCKGDGVITVDMQFLPDVKLVCETCGGKRFKQMVLEVRYKDHSIHDLLQLTVDQAMELLADHPKVTQRLEQLQTVGLGYLRLGQSTATLSGGEAQRLKLASYLNRKESAHTVYLFDEPTTGLHLHDVALLLEALHRLVDQGNTVIIIEHHLDVIKNADWLVDLGPDGGDAEGGQLVYAGPPEGLLEVPESWTGRYLAPKLAPKLAPSLGTQPGA